jgi:hypothetical protein
MKYTKFLGVASAALTIVIVNSDIGARCLGAKQV